MQEIVCASCLSAKEPEEFQFLRDRDSYRKSCRKCASDRRHIIRRAKRMALGLKLNNISRGIRVDASAVGQCKRCNAVKPSNEFNNGACLSCNRRSTISRINRQQALRRNYGITPEKYADMLLVQGGVCAICGMPETTVYRGRVKCLHVDHDHMTGKVRSLLCARCNTAIGLLREDPDLMIKAAYYIKAYSGIESGKEAQIG